MFYYIIKPNLLKKYNPVPILNTLRPRQNVRYFPDDILKCIFLSANVWVSIKIALKSVPKGSISNIPALVQIIAWCRPGDKPLSEPMMVRLPMHICVTRPQWVTDNNIAVLYKMLAPDCHSFRWNVMVPAMLELQMRLKLYHRWRWDMDE